MGGEVTAADEVEGILHLRFAEVVHDLWGTCRGADGDLIAVRLQPGEGLVEALHLRHTFAVDVAEHLFHANRALCGVAEARIRGLEDL